MDLEWSDLVETIVSGIIAYICLLALEPKKQRMNDYNASLSSLSDELARVHGTAIEYWSQRQRMEAHEVRLVSGRTEINRQVESIRDRNYSGYRLNDIRTNIARYFQIVTGGTFQQNNRPEDPTLMDKADKLLADIRNDIDKSRIPFNVWNIWCAHID